MNQKQDGVLRYAYNLFAFPKRYFEQHTAEELEVTEDERQQLIKMQAECEKRKEELNTDSASSMENRALREFEKEFFSE